MQGFDGFEPAVGAIRALRTFRVDRSGALLPLYGNDPWRDGPNRAVCAPPAGQPARPHRAPDPACTCGFYGYGSSRAAARTGDMRYVQAVVCCWGRVVAGTRGVRSEYARIEAVWLAPSVPPELRAAVARRYPRTRILTDRDALLAEHPLTALDSYDGSAAPRHRAAELFCAAVLLGLGALGLLPATVLRHDGAFGAAWLTATVAVAVLFLWTLGSSAPARRSSALLLGELLLWLLAPALGLLGWVSRVPLLAAAGSAGWARIRRLRPGYFPVVAAPRERSWPGR